MKKNIDRLAMIIRKLIYSSVSQQNENPKVQVHCRLHGKLQHYFFKVSSWCLTTWNIYTWFYTSIKPAIWRQMKRSDGWRPGGRYLLTWKLPGNLPSRWVLLLYKYELRIIKFFDWVLNYLRLAKSLSAEGNTTNKFNTAMKSSTFNCTVLGPNRWVRHWIRRE